MVNELAQSRSWKEFGFAVRVPPPGREERSARVRHRAFCIEAEEVGRGCATTEKVVSCFWLWGFPNRGVSESV
jgi:hypothetical protein